MTHRPRTTPAPRAVEGPRAARALRPARSPWQRRRHVALVAAAASSLLSLPSAPGIAAAGPSPAASPNTTPSTVTAEVMVLHATNAGAGIDGRVGNLAQLKKPPFSAYDTYKLLTQARTPLVQGAEAPAVLPDGGQVRLTLKQAVSQGRRKMAVSIQKSDGSVFLPLAEVTTGADEPFFVAGYRHKSGILVIGIKLVSLPRRAPVPRSRVERASSARWHSPPTCGRNEISRRSIARRRGVAGTNRPWAAVRPAPGRPRGTNGRPT
jgi:hypothetical protein